MISSGGMPQKKTPATPSFVRGRKGRTSLVDCCVAALWKTDSDEWPELTFEELRAIATKVQGYHVTPSTVRSTIYERSDLFERSRPESGPLKWKLTKAARKGNAGGN